MPMLVKDPTTMAVQRTHKEIVERIRELAPTDFFGFQTADLLAYLPWDHAKNFLKMDASESTWRARYPVFEPPLKAALDYLPFAWKCANRNFGVSAWRSIEHMKAWMWLAGYDAKTLNDLFNSYTHYGKGPLVFVSEIVGFNWRNVDDGEWVMDANEDPGLNDAELHAEISKWVELANIHRKE